MLSARIKSIGCESIAKSTGWESLALDTLPAFVVFVRLLVCVMANPSTVFSIALRSAAHGKTCLPAGPQSPPDHFSTVTLACKGKSLEEVPARIL